MACPWSLCYYLPACMRTGSLPWHFRLMVMHILHRILSFEVRNSRRQPEFPEPIAEQGRICPPRPAGPSGQALDRSRRRRRSVPGPPRLAGSREGGPGTQRGRAASPPEPCSPLIYFCRVACSLPLLCSQTDRTDKILARRVDLARSRFGRIY